MEILKEMEQITWKHFERIELRVGTIIEVDDFPQARKPTYKLKIDFGELGVKRSSAQKQVANFFSEVLTTGFYLPSGEVVLAQPERLVPNGAKLG